MATNDLKDIDGFILREFDYKESSKIIEVFTKDLGRISVIAKGINKKNSKNLALSQRFILANLSLYKTKGQFYGLKEGDVKKSYPKSKKSYDIILYKSAIADLLTRTMDQIQIETVYTLLDHTFDAFEEADGAYINIFLSFLLKYVSFSGYKPNFTSCGICGKKISGNDFYFSKDQSSIVCDDCKGDAPDRTYLTRQEYLYFYKLLYTRSEELKDIELVENFEKIGKIIIDYSLKNLDLGRFSSIEWVIKALERNVNVL